MIPSSFSLINCFWLYKTSSSKYGVNTLHNINTELFNCSTYWLGSDIMIRTVLELIEVYNWNASWFHIGIHDEILRRFLEPNSCKGLSISMCFVHFVVTKENQHGHLVTNLNENISRTGRELGMDINNELLKYSKRRLASRFLGTFIAESLIVNKEFSLSTCTFCKCKDPSQPPPCYTRTWISLREIFCLQQCRN